MAEISTKKRIWGWFFFDWASQPYHTLLLTFIFGPFFAGVAASYYQGAGFTETVADAKAQSLWSWCLTISGLIIGLGAPLMGALADTAGRRIPWIAGFSLLYVFGAAALWWTDPQGGNMWQMLLAFGIGFIGAEYALIFANSQLPGLGDPKEVGKISGSGFAFGYLGGLVALAIMLILFVEQPNGRTIVGLAPVLALIRPKRRHPRRRTVYRDLVRCLHDPLFPLGQRAERHRPTRQFRCGAGRSEEIHRRFASPDQPVILSGLLDALS